MIARKIYKIVIFVFLRPPNISSFILNVRCKIGGGGVILYGHVPVMSRTCHRGTYLYKRYSKVALNIERRRAYHKVKTAMNREM